MTSSPKTSQITLAKENNYFRTSLKFSLDGPNNSRLPAHVWVCIYRDDDSNFECEEMLLISDDGTKVERYEFGPGDLQQLIEDEGWWKSSGQKGGPAD